jgi:hypothetical protein
VLFQLGGDDEGESERLPIPWLSSTGKCARALSRSLALYQCINASVCQCTNVSCISLCSGGESTSAVHVQLTSYIFFRASRYPFAAERRGLSSESGLPSCGSAVSLPQQCQGTVMGGPPSVTSHLSSLTSPPLVWILLVCCRQSPDCRSAGLCCALCSLLLTRLYPFAHSSQLCCRRWCTRVCCRTPRFHCVSRATARWVGSRLTLT